jgi:hypothetical protein
MKADVSPPPTTLGGDTSPPSPPPLTPMLQAEISAVVRTSQLGKTFSKGRLSVAGKCTSQVLSHICIGCLYESRPTGYYLYCVCTILPECLKTVLTLGVYLLIIHVPLIILIMSSSCASFLVLQCLLKLCDGLWSYSGSIIRWKTVKLVV